jgi:hypothetical protein
MINLTDRGLFPILEPEKRGDAWAGGPRSRVQRVVKRGSCTMCNFCSGRSWKYIYLDSSAASERMGDERVGTLTERNFSRCGVIWGYGERVVGGFARQDSACGRWGVGLW